MRLALLATLLGGGFALAADDPIKTRDLSNGREPAPPFTTKITYHQFMRGKHVATYVNVHAHYRDVEKPTDPKEAPYRFWVFKSAHTSGVSQEKGARIVDADGKVWVGFAYGDNGSGGTKWLRCRPAPAAP